MSVQACLRFLTVGVNQSVPWTVYGQAYLSPRNSTSVIISVFGLSKSGFTYCEKMHLLILSLLWRSVKFIFDR